MTILIIILSIIAMSLIVANIQVLRVIMEHDYEILRNKYFRIFLYILCAIPGVYIVLIVSIAIIIGPPILIFTGMTESIQDIKKIVKEKKETKYRRSGYDM